MGFTKSSNPFKPREGFGHTHLGKRCDVNSRKHHKALTHAGMKQNAESGMAATMKAPWWTGGK